MSVPSKYPILPSLSSVILSLDFSSFFFSATSVDVEEHLYRIAKELGITVITSSQVIESITCSYVG